MLAKYYRVSEVAANLHLSTDTVIRQFQGKPGVVSLPQSGKVFGKRKYDVLLIPEETIDRVLASWNDALPEPPRKRSLVKRSRLPRLQHRQ
jgi:hypothetical protein